jgi:hypothetical protein
MVPAFAIAEGQSRAPAESAVTYSRWMPLSANRLWTISHAQMVTDYGFLFSCPTSIAPSPMVISHYSAPRGRETVICALLSTLAFIILRSTFPHNHKNCARHSSPAPIFYEFSPRPFLKVFGTEDS